MNVFPPGWTRKRLENHSVSSIKNSLVNIPKYPKRAILMTADFLLFSFALWAAFSLRFSVFYLPPNIPFTLILLCAPVTGVLCLFFMNIYKNVTRFITFSDIIQLHLATTLSVIIWVFTSFFLNTYAILPRSVPMAYWIFAIFLVWAMRWLVAALLKDASRPALDNITLKKIIIYGAGVTGTQLAETLSKRSNFEIKAFIDDNPALWKRRIAGHKIHSPDDIPTLLRGTDIREIILALPSATPANRKRVLRLLEPYPLAVRTLPAVEDIVSGHISVGNLRLVGVDDLLGRDPVPADMTLFDKVIRGKSVLVTGAGGSIGSELSRQIFRAIPEKLLLFEISEAALYLIEQDLLEHLETLVRTDPDRASDYNAIAIIPLLGSVQDADKMKRVMIQYGVHTVFHAAAYKHVPLVEANPMAGICNNFLGTRTVAETALACSVERFVLISTDKAVRPTNVMGATKRLAEMQLQALSDKHKGKDDTIFTMVRFGNVLDSSGSVVQKFRKQITEGGPVTVTHPDIIRYFMSIPEAAELVIQAGAMAKGGEVYVLDMGEPVRIARLAATMIRLMGLEVRDQDNPDGDIEISYVGLRPGEKLYEELLLEETSEKTAHSRIQKNNEPFLKMDDFTVQLEILENAIQNNNTEKLYKALEGLVSGYVPSKEIKVQV